MANNQQDRHKRLLAYSTLALSAIALQQKADAQIVYTDVDPDSTIFVDEMALDMDGNGTIDFKLVFLSELFLSWAPPEFKLRINPLGSNMVNYAVENVPVTYSGTPWYTYVGGATQIQFTNIPILDEGDEINGDMDFHLNIAGFYSRLFFYIYSESVYQSIKGGDWNGTENKFAGIKFYTDGAYHYGWMRVSVNAETGIVLHDYAWEMQAETPIIAQEKDFKTHWISAADAGITESPEDLAFSFTGAVDEADIANYKVICAKENAADDITVDDANALPSDRYITIIPDGTGTYSGTFNAATFDADGDPIITGQNYRLVILEEMTAASNFVNMLSNPSDVVLLVDTVQAVVDPTLADINNTGTAADLRVKFQSPDVIQGISEFRIIVAQKDVIEDITLEDALAIPSTSYFAVAPGEPEYTIVLPESLLDAFGNPIQPERYKVIILSVADGTSSVHSTLSVISGLVVLEQATSVISDIILSDIAETGNGADLQVAFSAPAFEQTVDEYRLMFVDFVTAFDFDLATAQASTHFYSITPNGGPYTFTGDATTTDSNGEPIIWGVPYYAYILSIPGDLGMEDTLSAPSNQVIMNFPVVLNAGAMIGDQINILQNGSSITLDIPETGFAVLYDAQGRAVWNSTLQSGTNTLLPDLPAATYTLTVVAGAQRQALQVVLH